MKTNGITASVPLFFNPDSSIDFPSLEKYLSCVLENKKLTAIYSMAYNTRYRYLSDAELLEVNGFVADLARGAGKDCYVGHPYTFDNNSLHKYFSDLRKIPVSGVSMLYPERYFGIDEPVLKFLSLPSKYDLKVVFHEMKLVSGFNGELVNWPMELLDRVLDEVDLIAVKEDSKDDVVSEYVLRLCNERGVNFVLAGGGKRRLLKFLDRGVNTWLNGSTMFLPELIDKVYDAFIESDHDAISFYIENIESPFFDKVVAKSGWHLAHKSALEYFGFGSRCERFPHPVLSDETHSEFEPIFSGIRDSSRIFSSKY